MKLRPFGTLKFDGTHWIVAAEPHVMLKVRRVFEGASKTTIGHASLSNKPDVCRDLLWFIDRYPLTISDDDKKLLEDGQKKFVERIQRMEDLLDPTYTPPTFKMAIEPRDYQRRATGLYLSQHSLLLADDLGLGKSCMAISSFTDPRTLPAVIVCYPHLQHQWQREVKKFMPELTTHILKVGTPYELPKVDGRGPDVLIVSWSKLNGWAQVLQTYCKSIVFDEAQELRRQESLKYSAACSIASQVQFRVGLTATPIYNFGGEMFSLLNVLAPGALGDWQEFYREWCTGYDNKARIKDPKAFGAYLREQGLMLRRTRHDVGRELPPVQKIIQAIDSDARKLDEVKDKASALAKIILNNNPMAKGEKMHAAEELSNLLRQATGIAKAPFVAEFVRMLCESGKPVVLVGWHHAVYEIWKSRLKDLRVGCYTGLESPNQKEEVRRQFLAGELDVMILSLRSGVGLDGLQEDCDTIVFGEMDWAAGVHEQVIGRLHRDGQDESVAAYFLISDDGSDPIMCEILGLKKEQSDGIRDPNAALIAKLEKSEDHIKRLAEQYAEKHKLVA